VTEASVAYVVPLTGEQYEISDGPYRAAVTGLGAGLRTLSHDGTELVHGFEADELPPAGSGQLLAPWPNRIDGGTYSFEGASYQLAVSEPAKLTAIHGLTRWAAWSVVSRSGSAVALRCAAHGQQGYPFSVELTATYSVSAASGLTVTVTAVNRGTRAAPYGLGFHPYLTVETPSIDSCTLTLPASQVLPLDARGIPSGPPSPVAGTEFDFRSGRVVGETRLDHALTGLDRAAPAAGDGVPGRAWAHLASRGRRVSLWAGPGYDWLQVFTGDPLEPDRRRKAIAIEPMTCPPNAFVTGHDLITLHPRDEVTHSWGITAAPG
jgi:aldose 1-epimerase